MKTIILTVLVALFVSQIASASGNKCSNLFNSSSIKQVPVEVFISGDAKTRESRISEIEKHIGHYDFSYLVREEMREGQMVTVFKLDGKRSDIELFVQAFIPNGEKQIKFRERSKIEDYKFSNKIPPQPAFPTFKEDAKLEGPILQTTNNSFNTKTVLAYPPGNIFLEFPVSAGDGRRKEFKAVLQNLAQVYSLKVTVTETPRNWSNVVFRDGVVHVKIEGAPAMIEKMALQLTRASSPNIQSAFEKALDSIRSIRK